MVFIVYIQTKNNKKHIYIHTRISFALIRLLREKYFNLFEGRYISFNHVCGLSLKIKQRKQLTTMTGKSKKK